MANIPLSEEKQLMLLEKFWNWLVAGPNLDSWTSIIFWIFVLIIILILSTAVFCWALGTVLEFLAKALDAYKKSGLPQTFGKEKKAQIRRRRQFCKVLNSDLLTLAKAENWNDQYFTDLEAEVEAEGRYYANLLHKMLRRQSQGLRPVSSLISAIELSTEQSLLIVGQPGSGKSVALRHLAHQFAERGIQSGDPDTVIPLYLNLKELNTNLDVEVNADVIKQFVLDNIRRGDADTVAYVHEHWDEYRARGIWFFLFDSFDEIPAVLHAPTESTVIHQHAEAIRQFLEGMSNCRGVLASREYKGPNALPWQKIRILPLSDDKQEQLIENSFLEPKQKWIVHQHIASNKSSLKNNPLFLTLLCRYIKDHNQPPINDHDLLSEHVDRLARRDEDYTRRKYGLTPDQLIEGAIQIAVLFAERRNLSLAPTQTEIAAELNNDRVPGGSLENMLGALVDVKIGRSDVQEARAGDRRFTFAHRRYQETLFVRHLARTESYLSSRELLTDTRWREYSVTLLQTQELATIEPLLIEATKLIAEYATQSARVSILQEFGGNLGYYKWKNDPAVPLLTILQEGLERRLNDIPSALSIEIEKLLSPRWLEGDIYDQRMVLKYGGLLPQSVLSEYIAFAVKHGEYAMEYFAFQRVIFLKNIPDTLENWVRERLSNEAIHAQTQADIFRLEALAARLPSVIGAKFVIQRCQLINKLRRPFRILSNIVSLDQILLDLLDRWIPTLTKKLESPTKKIRRKVTAIAIMMDFIFPLYLILTLSISTIILSFKKQNANTENDAVTFAQIIGQLSNSEYLYLYGGIGLSYVMVIVTVIALYLLCSVGEKIGITYIYRSLNKFNVKKILINGILKPLTFSIFVTMSFLAPGAIAHGGALLLGFQYFGVQSYIVAWLVFIFFGTFILLTVEFFKVRQFQTRLRILKNEGLGTSLVLHAQASEELHYWLKKIDLDVTVIRSLLRVLRSPPLFQAEHPIFGLPLFKLDWDENSTQQTLNRLTLNMELIFIRNSNDSSHSQQDGFVAENPPQNEDINIDF